MFNKASLISLLALCATQVVAIDFSGSNFIWTNEGNPAPGVMPPGSRAFRRAVYAPRGKKAFSADILITTDNEYKLFVNQVQIGTGNSLNVAQLYHIPLTKGCNVFAVNGTNTGTVTNPAGLIATIKVHYTDGSTDTIITDQSWKAFTSVPAGFEDENFPDGSWPAATVVATFDSRPDYWANIMLPPDAAQF